MCGSTEKIPPPRSYSHDCGNHDSPFVVTEQQTRHALTELDVNKVAGPDNIKPRQLKKCSNQLASIFTFIFSLYQPYRCVSVNNHTGAEETFPRNTE
ncbi:Non-LTR (Long terminal repeat) retrotransposon and domain-containing protein [Elysia marginata]|uniref:Non-LTR (Long terminal repeat) retrotransposon and domain-containing protein n=1 Tax=Elysia marginata TaxID=1093978 RepID=A0AAV4GYK2_9GAST|nr:Non-LTR (Long terminal repeat) retrotransposon and domain-containing protein [Elysia marginata]